MKETFIEGLISPENEVLEIKNFNRKGNIEEWNALNKKRVGNIVKFVHKDVHIGTSTPKDPNCWPDGNANEATADYTIALGYNNVASADDSTAVGYNNDATGEQSSVFGFVNTANYRSLAVGFQNEASNNYCVALGYQNDALGSTSLALGYQNETTDVYASAVGWKNTAGSRGSAFGVENTASSFGLALGANNRAVKGTAHAVGYSTFASGYYSSAMGSYTRVGTDDTTEIGQWSSTSGREGSVRIHDNGLVALTMRSGSAPTASATAAGYEISTSLASGMYTVQRNGSDYILYHNTGSAINSITLGASEADTLQSVTDRGNTTTNSITMGTQLIISGSSPECAMTPQLNTQPTQVMFNNAAGSVRGRISYYADSESMRLSTANLERVRIDSAGNVGIGSAPTNKLDVFGHFTATTKSFLIDHPTKENKKLQYASLEGPEHAVYVRGTHDGSLIELPEYWSELVHKDSLTVSLTPLGEHQNLYVKYKDATCISVGGVEGSYDYIVYGERKDTDKLEVEPLKV